MDTKGSEKNAHDTLLAGIKKRAIGRKIDGRKKRSMEAKEYPRGEEGQCFRFRETGGEGTNRQRPSQ